MSCTHNAMVERKDDPRHAWECAECGYVYAQAAPEVIAVARDLYETPHGDCDIEIDDDAAMSENDCGVWVAAWVFVHNEELGIEEEPLE